MAVASARVAELTAASRRLCNSAILTDREVEHLEEMQEDRVSLDGGHDFVREGDPFANAYVLQSGWALRYRVTPEGKRQILSFVLPGDFVGLHANYERHAAYSVQTLGCAELGRIEPIRLLDLYRNFPILASGLDWVSATNFNILAEHAVSLGVRTARRRILHLLLELQCRLMSVGLAREDGFENPMTQIHIADSLGLTPVYVSRCLKQLRAEKLVDVRRGYVSFPDLSRAFAAASFDAAFLEPFLPRSQPPNRPVARMEKLRGD